MLFNLKKDSFQNMWKLINIQSQDYLINFEFGAEQASLKVLFSNFDNLWISEFDEKQLLQTFNKFNPLIELDNATLMKEIENVFMGQRNDVSWDIQTFETALKLKLKSRLAGVPFRFEIEFNVTSNRLLFQSIVLPLLILVKGMQKQNEYLCDVLRKKDMEITEYKLDGAVLSRKTVETPQFDNSILSRILNENLETLSFKQIDSLLDENLTQNLDKISRLSKEKTNETDNAPTENDVSDLSEPPKKKLIESDTKTTIKMERLSNPMSQKPTIKKITRVKKRLQNL